MNRFWKEELENKLKNKIFMWDVRSNLWRNVHDPTETMTDGQYEAIYFALSLLGKIDDDYPLP